MQNETFTTMSPFRFWCNKVLPAVYDDSLSYYELLCKVVKYLNDLGELVNEHSEAITELRLKCEDLQQQIQDLIDGDFSDIIAEKVEEWFQENEPEIMQTLADLQDQIDQLENDTDERLDGLQDEIDLYKTKTYVNNNLVNSDPYQSLSQNLFDADMLLGVRQDLTDITIESYKLNGVSLKEIFEDGNIIEVGASSASWDTGAATLTNCVINTVDGIRSFEFNSNGNKSEVTFPSRAFEVGHTYILLGQYLTQNYSQGFYGYRCVNRNMFDPFTSNYYKSFMYPVTNPGSEENHYYQGLPINERSVQPLKVGCFYDEYALRTPYVHTNVRFLTLLDLGEVFGADIPNMLQLRRAFDVYTSLKLGKTSQIWNAELKMRPNYYAADRSNFVRLMKYRALSLGMGNAHFYTPSGFPQNGSIQQAQGVNYGTVKDLMRMGMAALSNQKIQTYISMANTPMVIPGYLTDDQSIFSRETTSDYLYSLKINPLVREMQNPARVQPYDILSYKGGALGALANPMPWEYAQPNQQRFQSYVGVCEFMDNTTLIFAIHGYKGGYGDVFNLLYGIQQYMISAYNKGRELTTEEELELSNAQSLYATVRTLENDIDPITGQPMAWGAMVLPTFTQLYNAQTNAQIFDDGITSQVHLHHFANETKLYPFASTSKLLTCLLAIESELDLSKGYRILDGDIVGGSGSELRPGMVLSLKELIIRALWNSDNDACEAIGRIVGHELFQQYVDASFMNYWG